jgi:hypothetical protein
MTTLGQQLGNIGAQRAYRGAGMEWSEIAWASAVDFLNRVPRGETFQSQDIITHAEMLYGERSIPAEPRAWGWVIKSLARDRAIIKVGYESTNNPNNHGRPCAVWQVV